MVMAERKTWMPGGSRWARVRRPSCARSLLLARGRGTGSHRLGPSAAGACLPRLAHSPAAARADRRGLRPAAGTAYYYRVRAYNDIGEGEYSDVASAATSWAPTAVNPPMDHLAMAVAKRSDGHVVPGEFYAYDYDGIGNRGHEVAGSGAVKAYTNDTRKRGLMRNGQAFVAIVAIYRRGAKKPR